MVEILGRPCAFFTTSSGSNPCSRAHPAHARATVGVESTNPPSRSKSTARQQMLIMIHDRHKPANYEMIVWLTFFPLTKQEKEHSVREDAGFPGCCGGAPPARRLPSRAAE